MKNYTKTQLQPMFPWSLEEDFNISISAADKANGSPRLGDMIAVNPNNPEDRWLVAEKFFKFNYKEESVEEPKKVKYLQTWGDPDTFKLISTTSNLAEGWLRNTRAMEIEGLGCMIKTSSHQKNGYTKRFLTIEELAAKYPDPLERKCYEEINEANYVIAEALSFVPNTTILVTYKDDEIIGRSIVKI